MLIRIKTKLYSFKTVRSGSLIFFFFDNRGTVRNIRSLMTLFDVLLIAEAVLYFHMKLT